MSFLLERMRIDQKETAMLCTDQNGNHHDKENIVQLMFEKFGLPAFFTMKKSIQSLFANGRTTGLVLEAGATTTQIVPVSEGYILYKAMGTYNLGGDTLTQNLLNDIEKKTGKEVLPYFYYRYTVDTSNPEKLTRTVMTKNDVCEVSPEVLQFHKLRVVQEIKEQYLKNSHPNLTPSNPTGANGAIPEE